MSFMIKFKFQECLFLQLLFLYLLASRLMCKATNCTHVLTIAGTFSQIQPFVPTRVEGRLDPLNVEHP